MPKPQVFSFKFSNAIRVHRNCANWCIMMSSLCAHLLACYLLWTLPVCWWDAVGFLLQTNFTWMLIRYIFCFFFFLHAKISKVIYLLLQVVYMSSKWSRRPVQTASQSVRAATMAFVPAPSPTVVDQTTLMKKYLQFVAALTDANTRKFINLAVYFLVSGVWKIWKNLLSFRKYLFDFVRITVSNADLLFE